MVSIVTLAAVCVDMHFFVISNYNSIFAHQLQWCIIKKLIRYHSLDFAL